MSIPGLDDPRSPVPRVLEGLISAALIFAGAVAYRLQFPDASLPPPVGIDKSTVVALISILVFSRFALLALSAGREASGGRVVTDPLGLGDALLAIFIGFGGMLMPVAIVRLIANQNVIVFWRVTLGAVAAAYCVYRWIMYPKLYEGFDAKLMHSLAVVGGVIGLTAIFD